MFANTPLANTPTFKLILGFGLCTIGGAMLYTYFKNRDEDEERNETEIPKTQKQAATPSTKKVQLEKPITIKLEISNEHIPLVLGRGGTNVNTIEEKTLTTIRFRDKNDTHKFCDITGLPNDVKEARAILLKEIERSPIIKEEIFVPQSVCGKIMGRCGEAMQEICRVSMAKLALDAGVRGGGNMDRRKITITGNRQQVNIARKMIEDKVEEDAQLRRAVEEVEQHREPRRSPGNSVNSSMYSSQNSLSSHLAPREKLMAARNDEKPMEVYVSAIASPAKFWVQLIGPQSKKLDDLVKTMTSYYSDAENRALHKISEPYLGQIVAAAFKYDGKWYRAEIVGILPNQYNPNEVVLDLYFVDYGDSEYVAPHEVYELRTDFLTLRFQAVECFMANLKSTRANEPDAWDPQAVERFEEMTQVANWKKLISRVVTYKERPKAATGTAAVREGSPIPGVELFDISEGIEINIGHLLISHGYALPPEDEPRSRSPYFSSPETSMYQPQPLSPISPTQSSQFESNAAMEDAKMTEQLKYLQKHSKNSPNSAALMNPTALSEPVSNGHDKSRHLASANLTNGSAKQQVHAGNLTR